MNVFIEFDASQTGKKWISYFDILGFSRFVCKNEPSNVFFTYTMCLEEFRRHEALNKKYGGKLQFIQFSDSFLIYAPNDTAGSFAAIQSCSRWFFDFLLQKRIPVSGAMACNEFYADRDNSIYFGKALVEASKLSESLDWIGFVLCPSAVGQLSDVGLHADYRLNFRKWIVPSKSKSDGSEPEPTYAYLINHTVNGTNTLLEVLESMATSIEEPRVKVKYSNTIAFLEHFQTRTKAKSPAPRFPEKRGSEL